MKENIFGKWILEDWISKLIIYDPMTSIFEIQPNDIWEETIFEVWAENKFTSAIYSKGMLSTLKDRLDLSNYCIEFSSDKRSKSDNHFILRVLDLKKQEVINEADWELTSSGEVNFLLWDYPIFSQQMNIDNKTIIIKEFMGVDEMTSYVHEITLRKANKV